MVLLPATDRRGAVICREAAGRLGDGSRIAPPDQQSITVSAGVATARPAIDATPEDLIAAAERALSKAKLAGRNRVVIEEDVAAASLA